MVEAVPPDNPDLITQTDTIHDTAQGLGLQESLAPVSKYDDQKRKVKLQAVTAPCLDAAGTDLSARETARRKSPARSGSFMACASSIGGWQ
jgi:hypothetical protein